MPVEQLVKILNLSKIYPKPPNQSSKTTYQNYEPTPNSINRYYRG